MNQESRLGNFMEEATVCGINSDYQLTVYFIIILCFVPRLENGPNEDLILDICVDFSQYCMSQSDIYHSQTAVIPSHLQYRFDSVVENLQCTL